MTAGGHRLLQLETIDFVTPKVMGSKKKQIPFLVPVLPSNRSISCLKMELSQKCLLPPVKVFREFGRILAKTCHFSAKFTKHFDRGQRHFLAQPHFLTRNRPTSEQNRCQKRILFLLRTHHFWRDKIDTFYSQYPVAAIFENFYTQTKNARVSRELKVSFSYFSSRIFVHEGSF